VSLAIQKGVSTSAVLELNANTALSQTFGFLAQAQTAAEGTLQLTQFLGLSVIAEAIANANMSLDCITELTLTGTTIIVELITPGGRIVTITLESRNAAIAEEALTYTIL